MGTLFLTRFAYAPDGTFGQLELPDGQVIYTVEQPWNANKESASCIPDGVYSLAMRRSPVVERTSGGEYPEGWEVTDVPERTYIMLHPGNWPDDVAGCIAVGDDYRIIRGANAVANSQATFNRLMKALDPDEDWQIDIRPFLMEYP